MGRSRSGQAAVRGNSVICCSRHSGSRSPARPNSSPTRSSCARRRCRRPIATRWPPSSAPKYCRIDDRDRLLHAGGKSTLDLLRRADPAVQDAPDAVLLPGDDDEVAAILRYCAQHRIAVVPFGGGTSVVGGLDPGPRASSRAVVSLDLRRFDQLHSLDEVSGEAEFGAGVTGPDAERLLGERGFSLGHFPQSFEFATIGGFAATRSSGSGLGGLRPVQRHGARAARGHPGGRAGSGSRTGVGGGSRPAPAVDRLGGRLRRHHPGAAAGAPRAGGHPLRGVVVPGLRHRRRRPCAPSPRPAPARPSSGSPTRPRPASTWPPPRTSAKQQITGGCLAITAFEGTQAHVESRHAETRALLAAQGGTSLGEAPARAWEHGRFGAPYLRDSLLSAGALCETLETATNWSNIPR